MPRVGPAGLPRYGQGRRSRPRPAERRRLSCRPIEKVHKRTPLISSLRKKNRRLHSIYIAGLPGSACLLLPLGSSHASSAEKTFTGTPATRVSVSNSSSSCATAESDSCLQDIHPTMQAQRFHQYALMYHFLDNPEKARLLHHTQK